LGLADRLLPRRVVGFYVVGSVALGAFRANRSDVDFVAVTDGPLARRQISRLRLLHLLTGARSGVQAARRGRFPVPGTPNGVYVQLDDLQRPVSEIVPIASHTGRSFVVGCGFDVNPVVWKVFAQRGVALRGPAPETLGLQPQPELLRRWNLDNLDAYWRPWAERAERRGRLTPRLFPRWATAWGVLGAPRLHHTVATGEVIDKEAAGIYARETLGAEHHPIIDEALAFWRGERARGRFADRAGATASFVLDVVRSAAAR
jgi:hypothetical protein